LSGRKRQPVFNDWKIPLGKIESTSCGLPPMRSLVVVTEQQYLQMKKPWWRAPVPQAVP
jgi:hypothetical protein